MVKIAQKKFADMVSNFINLKYNHHFRKKSNATPGFLFGEKIEK